ncbi:uncharacterized protein LOC107270078 [Cephus cinctus]|uniref:Uncharacterized protein LOC107270078 n=1 Tax=Cephus cinctus TaxID=211228 RepID=A0AAJ7RLS6_CEPCN|nr:uncharacterized protein LOC107270078 [Cephus cinctus]
MSYEILPESVNDILDEVETNLCLPIILFILICTIHVALIQFMQIGSAVNCYLERRASRSEANDQVDDDNNESFFQKIKGMICRMNSKDHNDTDDCKNCPRYSNTSRETPEDEWDCCADSYESQYDDRHVR